MSGSKKDSKNSMFPSYAEILAAAGAFGCAVQNYQGVAECMTTLLANQLSSLSIQAIALGAGGLCSGLTNYWMNKALLEDFFKRMTDKGPSQVEKYGLTGWKKIQYYLGIAIFIISGILFGLVALTFALQSPLALAGIAVGFLVTTIMTIQEVETWLSSYDQEKSLDKTPLTSSQKTGKWIGHIMAIGNVIALSLLFTLSLSQSLMLLNVGVVPALIIGFAISFSIGAFTEYFFYNFYLSDFCKSFGDNMKAMNECDNAKAGYFCVITNALVNAALTYVGITLLASVIIGANIFCPPMILITISAALSALFAGSASFTLGVGFWLSQNQKKEEKGEVEMVEMKSNKKNEVVEAESPSSAKNRNSFWPLSSPSTKTMPLAEAKNNATYENEKTLSCA